MYGGLEGRGLFFLFEFSGLFLVFLVEYGMFWGKWVGLVEGSFFWF